MAQLAACHGQLGLHETLSWGRCALLLRLLPQTQLLLDILCLTGIAGKLTTLSFLPSSGIPEAIMVDMGH